LLYKREKKLLFNGKTTCGGKYKMKIGNKVKITNLDYFRDGETQEPIKRNKKLVNCEGHIVDINLGIFKVEFDDGDVEYFDGRELLLSETLKTIEVNLSFVSWQKNGKSIYGTEDETRYFVGDFRRGSIFKGTIELDEEEIDRVRAGEKEGIKAVFDIFIKDEEDRRKNRR
jgi:hypothetical protein